MKDYNNLKNSDYKKKKIFKLKSSLCLMLGSWCSDRKWILFFVDRHDLLGIFPLDGVRRNIASV